MLYSWSTCPNDVKEQINRLSQLCQKHLANRLVGIYIHGSLSLGSFNVNKSDLDIVVVVRNPIPLDLRFELVKGLLTLSNQPVPLEISFMTTNALEHWTYPPPFELHYSEYWRSRYEHEVLKQNIAFWGETTTDADLACHLRLVKHYGIKVWGEEIETIIPSIPEQDFITAIVGDAVPTLESLKSNLLYGVLSACRVLAYFETKEIKSKPEAGRWMITQHLQPELVNLVEQACKVYEGTREQIDNVSEPLLLHFISFIEARNYNHKHHAK